MSGGVRKTISDCACSRYKRNQLRVHGGDEACHLDAGDAFRIRRPKEGQIEKPVFEPLLRIPSLVPHRPASDRETLVRIQCMLALDRINQTGATHSRG